MPSIRPPEVSGRGKFSCPDNGRAHPFPCNGALHPPSFSTFPPTKPLKTPKATSRSSTTGLKRVRTSADICTAPDMLPIGIKRTQRHEEVHVGARKKLAVEGAPVQAWRRLLKRAGSGAEFGVVCWLMWQCGVCRQCTRAQESPPAMARCSCSCVTLRASVSTARRPRAGR